MESCDSEFPGPGHNEVYIPVAADPLDEAYDSLRFEEYYPQSIGSDYSFGLRLVP